MSTPFMSVSFSSAKLRAAIAKAPTLARAQFGQALEDIGNGFRALMGERMQATQKTGVLRRSLGHIVSDSPAGQKVLIGFYGEGGRYAKIREYGGTITANGKYSRGGKGLMLAIPLPAAKTANGRVRMGPTEYGEYDYKKNPTGLALIKSKRGNLLLVQIKRTGIKTRRQDWRLYKGQKGLRQLSEFTQTEREKMVPMFVLKRSVTQKGNLGFLAAWRGFQSRAMARVQRATAALLSAVAGKQGLN